MGELKITRKTNISLKPVILDEINLLRIKHELMRNSILRHENFNLATSVRDLITIFNVERRITSQLPLMI